MNHQSTSSADQPLETDMSVGEILRRTRIHYNQSFEDVERSLNIRAHQVEALENGCYDKLPGRVYVLGFLRAYSEYLGLDGQKMVALYKRQVGEKSVKPELDFPEATSDMTTPPVWLVFLCLLILTGVAIGWWLSQSETTQEIMKVPPVPETLKQTATLNEPETEESEKMEETSASYDQFSNPLYPDTVYGMGHPQNGSTLPHSEAGTSMEEPSEQNEESMQTSTAENAESGVTTTSAQEQQEKGIILTILENSWVEIRDKEGRALVSRVLEAGDQYFVPDRPGLTMSLGNAGGVQISVDGKPLNMLGRLGQVRRGIELNAESLRLKYSKNIENPAE